jgi:hypothetical protein
MLIRQQVIDSCQIQAAAGGGLGDTSLFAEDAGAEDKLRHIAMHAESR